MFPVKKDWPRKLLEATCVSKKAVYFHQRNLWDPGAVEPSVPAQLRHNSLLLPNPVIDSCPNLPRKNLGQPASWNCSTQSQSWWSLGGVEVCLGRHWDRPKSSWCFNDILGKGVKACQEGLDDVDVDIDFDVNVEFDVEVYLGAYVFSICLINVSTIHCLKKSCTVHNVYYVKYIFPRNRTSSNLS